MVWFYPVTCSKPTKSRRLPLATESQLKHAVWKDASEDGKDEQEEFLMRKT